MDYMINTGATGGSNMGPRTQGPGDGAFMGGDDPGLGRYGYSTAEFINKDTSHLFFAFGKTDYRFIPVNITRSRLAQVKKIESFVKDPLKNPKADYGIYHSSY